MPMSAFYFGAHGCQYHLLSKSKVLGLQHSSVQVQVHMKERGASAGPRCRRQVIVAGDSCQMTGVRHKGIVGICLMVPS